jgi:hypothetical protein
MTAKTTLRDLDALELAELLEFLGSFFASEEAAIADALSRFCLGGYSLVELRADLARFAFLLGGDGTAFVLGDNA